MAAVNENRSKSLLHVNVTYYVRTRKGTAITLWLPDATESDGEPIEVKDADGQASVDVSITIKTVRGQTIDGASSYMITVAYGSVIFRSNGQQWYSLSRGGDVFGPSSATDEAVARFNGGSGKLLQSSGVTIDDSANLTTTGIISSKGNRVAHNTYSSGPQTLTFNQFLVLDTGGITINLPASPGSANDGALFIIINNAKGSTTVGRNGSNINGAASDQTLGASSRAIIWWDNANTTWRYMTFS